MKKIIASAFVCGALWTALPVLAQSQRQIRSEELRFAPGRDNLTVQGRIRGYEVRDYQIRARAGQTILIDFRPSSRFAFFNLMGPGADAAMFAGDAKGNRFEGRAPASGVYRVRVYLVRAAARRGETASYSLAVSVRGAAGPERPVPGQIEFDATGQVKCGLRTGQPLQSCRAGVQRHPMGETTVRIFLPGNSSRYVYFKNGRASSSDGGQRRFTAAKRGSTTFVSVGSERYELPDSLVVGRR